mgnify:CR=1 FL=1
MRLALPGEDFSGKPLKALLPQLVMLATQHVSGAYKVVGLCFDGGRLDLDKTLRAQGVQRTTPSARRSTPTSQSSRRWYGVRNILFKLLRYVITCASLVGTFLCASAPRRSPPAGVLASTFETFIAWTAPGAR